MARLPFIDISLFINNILGEGESFVRKLANEIGRARLAGQSEAQIRESITTDLASGRGPVGGLVATLRDEIEARQQRLYNLGQQEVLAPSAQLKLSTHGIKRETEKAILARVQMENVFVDRDFAREIWFPKSQVKWTDKTVTAPEWLVRKKFEEVNAEKLLADPTTHLTFKGVTREESRFEAMFMWMATGSETCPSCIGRHGAVRSWHEWVQLGLPGQGRTICKYSCRCTLIPQARAEEIYGVEGVKAIETRAEEPLRRRLAEIKALEKVRGSDFAQSTFQAKLGDFRSIGSSATVTPRGGANLPANQKKIFQRVNELNRTGDIAEIQKWPRRDRAAVRTATEVFAKRTAKRQREVDIARAKRKGKT